MEWHTINDGHIPVNRVKTGSVFGIATYNSITGTVRGSNQYVGLKVCMYGSVTGEGCGEITRINTNGGGRIGDPDDRKHYESYTFFQMSSLFHDFGTPGNSGAPVFYANKAYGIIHAQRLNKATNRMDAIYMSIDKIDDIGISVLTD